MKFRIIAEVEFEGSENYAGAEKSMASAMTFMANHELMTMGLEEGARVKEIAIGIQRLDGPDKLDDLKAG